MAKVTLSGLNKWYGGVVHAVQDISFEIADGEFFGLLGPSGSGKTSVLRMLAGLEKPTSGTIAFDGVPVERQTPQARNVAMVFEQNALYPHMTARQNISYPLRIRGLSKGEIDAKVGEVADMLNIRHLIDRRASQMSGGQQQRVAIARALVRRPNLLCLDEPIAHLDTLLRARLRGELKRLQRSLGTTSVIVTHDPIEAMTMTDRIAVMRDGVMQQIGSADEIYNRPVNAFVAQFFGLHSMNVLEIDRIDDGAALSGHCGGEAVSLPDIVRGHVGADRKLALGARPAGVAVHKPGEMARDSKRLMLPGRVYVAEQLGDSLLVTVQAGETTLQAMTAPDRRFGIDEPVEISIREDSLYVFEGADRRTVRHAAGASGAIVDRLLANYA
ncbi:ABC transporter ATP-binding protein [Rhizobium sp. TRM95796]|uniref:ABC transporter ATP-binding protein n=1 Tax=Rhizobium sp. TRM95796 TaxID=2979862 RepID=UPI0021E8A9A1|nr:ABC transporter ATP-binding protein [Rhizobium sp. TRM95796]MCV3767781.1 ABC transporter ATP-binding protein [Rhizobium sp. TRM95796]